ncbi:MAG TPA: efflux RND transporter permease subunit [Thermoanaerobaculia bacterium]
MIERIIRFSAKNRLLVLALVAAACAAAVAVLGRIRLDALPDLSDPQVIVLARWDRSPDILEDQVAFPIVSALVSAPRVKAVRALSDFGYSFVYVVFQDGTDLYWARSRVLEYLSTIQPQLPKGVRVELGPDASGVGWIYQYALVDRSGRHSLAELRSLQDWTLRFALQAVPGVAEVASFGGWVKQIQITVDPNRLVAYGLAIDEVAMAVSRSNDEIGARLLEWSGAELMVRVRGYARTVAEYESIVLRATPGGTPVRLVDVARVAWGPELRRGTGDLDGEGDVVGGIVVARHGENALNVIRAVENRLAELAPTLPDGVEIVETYDRSSLIRRAIDTLRDELVLQMILVSLIILVFLAHVPSAIVPIVTIPVAILLAFIPLWAAGITVNIMSIAGIAISIGVLVDGAIVEVENAYNKIQRWIAGGKKGSFYEVRLAALAEVGPSVFFSLLVIAVAFLPVFTLVDQEGRLFRPLAWSKNLTMALAAILAVTLDPALRMLFARIDPYSFRPRWLSRLATSAVVGTYRAEEEHPISRRLHAAYEPVCRFTLRHPKAVLATALAVCAATLPLYTTLGREFMPPLAEGTILYMPTSFPGLSIGEAARALAEQDRVLAGFPEVLRVHGKAGRAATSTDPAPLSMFETVVELAPESEWRPRETWYSSWAPEPLRALLRPFWPDRITHEELVAEMDRAVRTAGFTNAWTMPIKGRIDMLSTGVRTPVGIKVLGPDLAGIERLGREIEAAVRGLDGTRSAFAERAAGGYFVDIDPDRAALARYGLTIDDLQRTVALAAGGENVATVVAGRERYPVQIRYPRELRDSPEALERILITAPSGAQVPLAQLARVEVVSGPAMVRNENGFRAGYVFVDLATSDVGGWVERAKAQVATEVKLPPGYLLLWSGQWENLVRVRERLKVVIPITLALITLLLYANTRSGFKTALVLAIVPFSAIGAVALFWALGYNVSIAAWVGMIALAGLDAETAVFMLLFLDLSWKQARDDGQLRTLAQVDDTIVHGAVKRVRPKLMTVATAFFGLLPILFSTATGADVLKRVAAPMIGGLVTSFLAELLLYPPAYKLWKLRTEPPGSSIERLP